MNANSKLPAPVTIKQWLAEAERKLQDAGIPSARLDTELLLADVLQRERTWLIVHADETIPTEVLDALEKNTTRRIAREPLAYIRGYKEFYGRDFAVSTDTLIPRPDTETIIELLKPLAAPGKKLIDIGTGSGAIVITAKLEYPELTVEGTDVSKGALEIAKKNAAMLGADITLYESDLLSAAGEKYDIICANLPYVDRGWQVSTETHFEPDLALYADDNGLTLVKKLIDQSKDRIVPSGFLFLEADPRQHDEIVAFGHAHDFTWYQTDGFIVVLQKV